MRLSTILGFLALFEGAVALSDSYPLVLLSTAKFQRAPDQNQIQTSSTVLKYTKDAFSTCLTERYLVVTQPGLHAADLSLDSDGSMPHLRRAVEDTRVQGRFDVAEVVGDIQHDGLVGYIKSECAKKGKQVTVDEMHLPPLSSQDRARSLTDNDAVLAAKLEEATKGDSYTILFLSIPGGPARESTPHLNNKRDVPTMILPRADNQTEWKDLPLFEKYQFFTPGIFMGLFVALLLLSILGVGLRALSSLEVSYGAFDKEMGPAAQKKQQ